MHYSRHRRYGDPNIRKSMPGGTYDGVECSVDGCSEPAVCKWMCLYHHMQAKNNNGDPLARKYVKRGTRTAEQKAQQQRECYKRYLATPKGKESHRRRGQINRNLKHGSSEDRLALREMFKATECQSCGVPYTSFSECRRTSRSIDHIVPLSLGGSDTIDNLRVICQSCNSRKQTKPI